MCIHYMYYGNEYGYLSNFFDNGVYFGINNMLKYENISRDEKQLCIFNRYLAKIDIFKCILNLDIAGKPPFMLVNIFLYKIMDLLYKKLDIVLYLICIGKGGYNMLIILDKLVFVRGGVDAVLIF